MIDLIKYGLLLIGLVFIITKKKFEILELITMSIVIFFIFMTFTQKEIQNEISDLKHLNTEKELDTTMSNKSYHSKPEDIEKIRSFTEVDRVGELFNNYKIETVISVKEDDFY